MESRKITVYQTKNQSKKTIMSAATTLAELKADLRANNIDYDGMTFFEGTAKVELKNDDSVLPHDVPFKGTITNELVFMLTNTNKKIRSGAMAMDRMSVYAEITKNNLQSVVKEKLGKNYTMCKTADLILIVENAPKKSEQKESIQSVETPKTAVAATPATPAGEFVDVKAREAITKLATLLEENGTLEYHEYEEVLDILGSEKKSEPTNMESSYSNSEIDDMFGGWTD